MPLELGYVEPMLPSLVPTPPEGDDWLHEIKYDGYRIQLVIEGSSILAFTRHGHDWSNRYRPITRAASDLDRHSAILDGEMIVQDEQGRSDFSAFKGAMERRPETLVFMASRWSDCLTDTRFRLIAVIYRTWETPVPSLSSETGLWAGMSAIWVVAPAAASTSINSKKIARG